MTETAAPAARTADQVATDLDNCAALVFAAFAQGNEALGTQANGQWLAMLAEHTASFGPEWTAARTAAAQAAAQKYS